jgi:hypothetical protein
LQPDPFYPDLPLLLKSNNTPNPKTKTTTIITITTKVMVVFQVVSLDQEEDSTFLDLETGLVMELEVDMDPGMEVQMEDTIKMV